MFREPMSDRERAVDDASRPPERDDGDDATDLRSSSRLRADRGQPLATAPRPSRHCTTSCAPTLEAGDARPRRSQLTTASDSAPRRRAGRARPGTLAHPRRDAHRRRAASPSTAHRREGRAKVDAEAVLEVAAPTTTSAAPRTSSSPRSTGSAIDPSPGASRSTPAHRPAASRQVLLERGARDGARGRRRSRPARAPIRATRGSRARRGVQRREHSTAASLAAQTGDRRAARRSSSADLSFISLRLVLPALRRDRRPTTPTSCCS